MQAEIDMPLLAMHAVFVCSSMLNVMQVEAGTLRNLIWCIVGLHQLHQIKKFENESSRSGHVKSQIMLSLILM